MPTPAALLLFGLGEAIPANVTPAEERAALVARLARVTSDSPVARSIRSSLEKAIADIDASCQNCGDPLVRASSIAAGECVACRSSK